MSYDNNTPKTPYEKKTDAKKFGDKKFGDKKFGDKKFGDKKFDGKKTNDLDMHGSTPKKMTAKFDRIAKVMARAGLCSRRDAERWIEDKRVSVNGRLLTSPAVKVCETDIVKVDGKLIKAPEATRLWKYYKPAGLVTSHGDPEGRPTVFSRLRQEGLPRVISVGRLDINTEGLILITNNGGLARHLEMPTTGWQRKYRARAYGKVTQDKLDSLKNGITVEGVRYGSIIAKLERQVGDNCWISMSLKEGKNREVKEVLGSLGLQVNRLIRISYGPFKLDNMERGQVEPVLTQVIKDQLGAAYDEIDEGYDAELRPQDQVGFRTETRDNRGGGRDGGRDNRGGDRDNRGGGRDSRGGDERRDPRGGRSFGDDRSDRRGGRDDARGGERDRPRGGDRDRPSRDGARDSGSRDGGRDFKKRDDFKGRDDRKSFSHNADGEKRPGRNNERPSRPAPKRDENGNFAAKRHGDEDRSFGGSGEKRKFVKRSKPGEGTRERARGGKDRDGENRYKGKPSGGGKSSFGGRDGGRPSSGGPRRTNRDR